MSDDEYTPTTEREREYLVQSTYKVTGTAIIRARSAREAVEIGLSPDTPNFNFSDAWGETKMTARLLPSGIHKPNDAEEGNR